MTDYRNRHRTYGDIELGDYLTRLRVARGYNQTRAAELLTEFTGTKWTQTTVSNIERGRTPCTVSQYVQLTAVYRNGGSKVYDNNATLAVPIGTKLVTRPLTTLPTDKGGRPRAKAEL